MKILAILSLLLFLCAMQWNNAPCLIGAAVLWATVAFLALCPDKIKN